MEIILLTHDRELTKNNNTGQLVRQCLGDRSKLIVWQRKNPDPWVMERLENKKLALLFPEIALDGTKSDSLNEQTVTRYDGFVIIDATWQQARKIYNHSDYLKTVNKVSLSAGSYQSQFKLRRNQIEGGLCTAECVVELLKLNSEENLAMDLLTKFLDFNDMNSSERV